MEYMGIKCRKLLNLPEKDNQFYAVIPLKALGKLGDNSDKAKMLALLYCYGRMNIGSWFTLSGKVLKGYDINPRQKRRTLLSFEEAGLLQLKRAPGKAIKIRLSIK
jgi:hypothetical protein